MSDEVTSVISSLQDRESAGPNNLANKVPKTFPKNLISYLFSVIDTVMRLQYLHAIVETWAFYLINVHSFPPAVG